MWNLRAKTPQQEQATVPWHQVCHFNLLSALSFPSSFFKPFLHCITLSVSLANALAVTA